VGRNHRNPNGVVTVLLKEFFPGLFNGRKEPSWTWKHYVAAPDTPDQDGVEYDNCLERVVKTFWVCFFLLHQTPYLILEKFID
jgi:hypothetical protein